LVLATEAASASLLKTDKLGRLRRSRQQREWILDEFERSGLAGPKFAALCGVKYQTLATWLQRRKGRPRASAKGRTKDKAAAQVRWLEGSIQSSVASCEGLALQLPGGVRAHLSHPDHIAWAAALVRALDKPC
jgi:transposase